MGLIAELLQQAHARGAHREPAAAGDRRGRADGGPPRGGRPGGRGGPTGRDLQRAGPAAPRGRGRPLRREDAARRGHDPRSGHGRPGRRARPRDAQDGADRLSPPADRASTARWSTCSRSATCCSASSRSAPRPWSRCAATSAAATRFRARSQRALIGRLSSPLRCGSRWRRSTPRSGTSRGTSRKIREAAARALAERADVVVLPELAVCGYPPGDLLERPSFLRDQTQALDELAAESREIAILTGAVLPAPQGAPKRLSNAAVLLRPGEIAHVQTKTLLPTYDVFDESRYFQPATERRVFEFRGRRVGIAICEDVWSGKFWGARRPYPVDPVEELASRRRGGDLDHLGLALEPGEDGAARGDAARRRAPAPRAGRVREPGRRQRRADLRRHELRGRRATRAWSRGSRASPRTSRCSTRSRRAGPRRRRSSPTRSCSSARSCSASATTWASSACAAR